MFIVNPDSFLLPSFRISPFKSEHISFNHLLNSDNFSDTYFDNRFGKNQWKYTYNGREAIKIALAHYVLQKDDMVTILTTSENFYISSCVTKEIETVCKWNREIVAETKVIFVNHEFGYPYPDMDKLVAKELPIIEDCCTTFYSQNPENKIGKYGDFTLYSFPKFFPIQIGGILTTNQKNIVTDSSVVNKNEIQYIQNVLSHNLRKEKEILTQRASNFQYGLSLFQSLGFSERFIKNKDIVPSCMLLNNNGIIKDLNALKMFFAQNGIQSSVFYGEDAFFIPNHQHLNMIEIDFVFQVFTTYLNSFQN